MREELFARELFERHFITQQHAGWAGCYQQQGEPPKVDERPPQSESSSSDAENPGSSPPLSPVNPATLESSLQPLHHVDPTGWMRRMALLETEVRALKYENERLKTLEHEKDALTAQIAAQSDLISALQAQSNFLGNCVANEEDVSDVSESSASSSSKTPPPPPPPEQQQQLPEFNSPEFQALIQSVGGPVGAVAMMFSVLNGQLNEQKEEQPPAKKVRVSAAE